MRKLDSDYLIPLSPLDYQILTALAECSHYGFALINQCAVDSEGIIEMTRGTIYPALKRLEKWGYVQRSRQEPGSGSQPRQIYTITSRGHAVFEQETARLRRAVHLAELRLRRTIKP